jgi:hypothetical protein
MALPTFSALGLTGFAVVVLDAPLWRVFHSAVFALCAAITTPTASRHSLQKDAISRSDFGKLHLQNITQFGMQAVPSEYSTVRSAKV